MALLSQIRTVSRSLMQCVFRKIETRMINSIKAYIGHAWSMWLNKKIKQHTDRETLTSILATCDRRPTLLNQVTKCITVETIFGFKINCDRNDYIGRKIIHDGVWEPLLAKTIRKLIRVGDLCVDIGANIGFDTLIMSTSTGSDGLVMAFEPDWVNIEALIQNLRLNTASNVQILSVGLGDRISSGKLDTLGERGHSNLRPKINDNIDHQCITILPLTKILDTYSQQRIRLIKLDVEGFEHKTLAGAQEILDRVDIVICEIDAQFLADCGDTPYKIFELMRSKGFQSYCAIPESDSFWVAANENFTYAKSTKTGKKPFDALFIRPETVTTEILHTNQLIK